MQAITAEKTLELLGEPICLDINLNDLRIMVGCFKAVAYLMAIEGEPYLDADALKLQKYLEHKYGELLKHLGNCRLS